MTSKYPPHDQLPPGAGDSVEVPARPAASVLVLREPFEILMMRRHERSSFVPGAWVFPGGAADEDDYELAREEGDDSDEGAMRVTAIRELFEESGIWLGAPLENAAWKRRRLLDGSLGFRQIVEEAPFDSARLVWTSRWITPSGLPKRFDTYFFLARAPERAAATLENDEAVELIWITPADALARHAAREFDMVFPTVKNLEAIAPLNSIDELIESRRGANVEPVQPLLVTAGDRKKIVLP